MHFNLSRSTVKDILSQELGLWKFSRRWASHEPSDSQKMQASALQSSYVRC
jgi:hypothetical protein